MPTRPNTVALITLPPRPPWAVLITTLWLLAAFMAAASIGVSVSPGRVTAAPILLVTIPLGLLGAVPATALTLLRARHHGRRRAARRFLHRQLRSLSPATDDAVASAVATAAGCIDDDARPLRRAVLDTWEARLGRRLPRLWVAEESRAALRRAMLGDPGPSADATEDQDDDTAADPLRCKALTRSLAGDLASILALSVAGVIIIAAVGLISRSWSGVLGFFATKALFTAAIAVPAVLWFWLRGQRGHALLLDGPAPRLVRLSRSGREAASWPMPANDTLVIITPAGRRSGPLGDEFGSLIWRLVPPAGTPPFEVSDPDPAATPWFDALRAAVPAELPDAAPGA